MKIAGSLYAAGGCPDMVKKLDNQFQDNTGQAADR
jgi:hypothetical protein